MLIAEKLLLLALDPETGRPPVGKRSALSAGLCGALASELVLRGAVELRAGRMVVVDHRPTGDDLLDRVVGLLAGEGGGRRVKGQLKSGKLTLHDVLSKQGDDTVGKMKVSTVLESLPGVGKVRARKLMEKLDIRQTAGLVRYAIRRGLIQP